MKLSHLTLAIASTVAMMSVAHAAGLERSQQPISPLFEEGNYAEVYYAYVNPDIKATDGMGNNSDGMLEDYGMAGASVKVAPTENTALALFYNKPWGVDTNYPEGSMFKNKYGTTQAHVDTDALGLVVGGKPNGSNIMLYGGIEYQKVSGKLKAAAPLGKDKATKAVLDGAGVSMEQYNQLIQGKKAGVLTPAQEGKLTALNKALAINVPTLAMTENLYDLDFEDDSTFVPMVGIAFEKPEIALRAALTYRAPAEYTVKGKESFTLGADPIDPVKNPKNYPGVTEVSFPQSVSLDFETGLSEKYQLLGMINARWVDWSEFEVAPPLNNILRDNEPLATYTDDQYSIEVALGKKFTPKFAAEIRASYDSGTGIPLSLLGPYDAVTGIALGAQYDITDKLTIGGGAQYLMIKGGEVPSSDPKAPALKVEDSNGYALGMKVGYHF